MNTAPVWTDALTALRACDDAVAWAESFASLDAAWSACERGDWMLWLLGRVSGAPESDARKALVLCACACARTALPYVRESETRPASTCIETAERWARGQATIGELREARRDAYAAAYAATAADAAAYAAYAAAAYAASASYAAADADADAAYAAAAASAAAAADAAAYAAAAAAYAAAPARALRVCADIVRQHYPTAPNIGDQR